ncbi:UNVERIFIED_CONTAM: hypothetical protein Slati_4234600 [Sesamum latifolium]|uniref:Integrase catalytic domain-containing protein n=1 Tax=Sesamum latifolium TaxID=2727402 RepID=A0AAW2TBN0_9LAMI
MKFIRKNIVCRFGIPREIISDNGHQFQGRRIQEWCQGLHIRQRFTTMAHPQANGQVEVTNCILIQGIKRRLERVGGNWAEELTSVLWAYRTTPRGSTGESPFSLVYGTEAIIPAELGGVTPLLRSSEGSSIHRGRPPAQCSQVIFPLPAVSKLVSSRPGELAPRELAAYDQGSSQPGELAPCELAVCDQASSRSGELTLCELAPSELVASSWDVDLATCELVALSIQWTSFS